MGCCLSPPTPAPLTIDSQVRCRTSPLPSDRPPHARCPTPAVLGPPRCSWAGGAAQGRVSAKASVPRCLSAWGCARGGNGRTDMQMQERIGAEAGVGVEPCGLAWMESFYCMAEACGSVRKRALVVRELGGRAAELGCAWCDGRVAASSTGRGRMGRPHWTATRRR